MLCVTLHMSPVTCHLSPVTCHLACLAYFLKAMLVKTAFMLKPWEALLPGELDCTKYWWQTDGHTDLNTESAQGPKDLSKKKIMGSGLKFSKVLRWVATKVWIILTLLMLHPLGHKVGMNIMRNRKNTILYLVKMLQLHLTERKIEPKSVSGTFD